MKSYFTKFYFNNSLHFSKDFFDEEEDDDLESEGFSFDRGNLQENLDGSKRTLDLDDRHDKV